MPIKLRFYKVSTLLIEEKVIIMILFTFELFQVVGCSGTILKLHFMYLLHNSYLFIMHVIVTIMSLCNVSIDLRVDISLNAWNELYCIINGGLVVSYSWKINKSNHYEGLFNDNQIINFTTGTSQVTFTNYSADLVGTFQCCITDGSGRTMSSSILPNGNTTFIT